MIYCTLHKRATSLHCGWPCASSDYQAGRMICCTEHICAPFLRCELANGAPDDLDMWMTWHTRYKDVCWPSLINWSLLLLDNEEFEINCGQNEKGMTFPFHIVDSEATLENKLIVKKGYKHGGGWGHSIVWGLQSCPQLLWSCWRD